MTVPRLLGFLVVSVSIALSASGARAAVDVLAGFGELSVGSTGSFTSVTSNLTGGDVISFTVDEAVNVNATSTPATSGTIFGVFPISPIDEFKVTLIENTDTNFSTFDELATATESGGEFSLFFSGLQPGTLYGFLFEGTLTGLVGQYDIDFQISAVPLPAALWLFLSALLGLFAVAKSRRRGSPERGRTAPATAG